MNLPLGELKDPSSWANGHIITSALEPTVYFGRFYYAPTIGYIICGVNNSGLSHLVIKAR